MDDKARAAAIIKAGGVIAFRTDTFYGLGADPTNASAVRKILTLKGREEGKPILLLISDRSLITNYLRETNEDFTTLSEAFWPGPLTLIGKAREDLPPELTAGTGTLGIRLPAGEEVRALVRLCGGALTATSANPAGEAPARTPEQVGQYFPAGVDLIIDGGEVTANEPSTVLDLTTPQARLIREGAVTQAEIRRVCSALNHEK